MLMWKLPQTFITQNFVIPRVTTETTLTHIHSDASQTVFKLRDNYKSNQNYHVYTADSVITQTPLPNSNTYLIQHHSSFCYFSSISKPHFQPPLSIPPSNSMGSSEQQQQLLLQQQQQQQETEPNRYFDHIPDEILHLILNKVLDKTLVRCLSLSKRFASIIPLTDAVSLPLFVPPRPRHPSAANTRLALSGSPVNILKSLVNFLIAKPLHQILHLLLLRRHHRHDPLSESPCQCPPRLLRTFHRITHLHFELHSFGGSVDARFLKWKATYGSQLKRCVVLCAISFRRGSSSRKEPRVSEEEEDESEEETTSTSSRPALANEDFKSRIMWTISCLIAASARHFLLKQMLEKFPTLKTIVITDVKRQGRFCMEEEDVRDLRDSLKVGGPALLSTEARAVPDLRMRMWYVPELELPAVGCVMEGATLLVIKPAAEKTEAEAAEKGGDDDGGFDGDEEEKAVFEEAERQILRKKKSSYVMEMTSF